jgi:flagellar protein FlbD
MIVLTRLNGHCLTVNSDLIKYAEASPDTVLTLITGEKLIVLETCEQVQERCMDYRAQSLRHAWPDSSVPLSANACLASVAAVAAVDEVSQQE